MNRIGAAGHSAVLLAAGLLLVGCGAIGSSSSAPASGGGSGSSSSSSGSPGGSGGSGGSAGSGGSGFDTTLFPATVGNTWIYSDTLAGNQTGTTTNMISAVTPDSAGERVTIKTHSDIPGLPSTPTELTYQFNSDGSIGVPYAQVGNNTVTIKSGGIVWPPAAELATGQPHTSTLVLQIKAAGHTITVQAHVTVKGDGTQSVTVPAGTYQATVVDETISEHFAGLKVAIVVKTWLASGIGPVKSVASTKSGTVSQIVSSEALKSFVKG
jgi:hypothetical protein